MAKNVIVSLEDAEFVVETIAGIYEVLGPGLSQKERSVFTSTIKRLRSRISRSDRLDEDGYFHDVLTDLEDEYPL